MRIRLRKLPFQRLLFLKLRIDLGLAPVNAISRILANTSSTPNKVTFSSKFSRAELLPRKVCAAPIHWHYMDTLISPICRSCLGASSLCGRRWVSTVTIATRNSAGRDALANRGALD